MKRRDCLLGGGILAMTLATKMADAQTGSTPAGGSDGPARKTKGRRILMFDVNETLLDLAPLKEPFEKAFGRPDALKTWFSTLLQYASVATLTGGYQPFGRLGVAAAETTAKQYGVSLDADAIKGLVSRIRTLPPHPDVKAGLESLKAAGFRLVTLTNSSPDAAEAQLKHAELRPLFEKVYTVEVVKVFKPHPATYRSVAEDLGVATSDLRLIAAHGWDIAGAQAAGCAGAFIARPGQELYPLSPRPDVVGPDLGDVATQIIKVEQPA